MPIQRAQQPRPQNIPDLMRAIATIAQRTIPRPLIEYLRRIQELSEVNDPTRRRNLCRRIPAHAENPTGGLHGKRVISTARRRLGRLTRRVSQQT
jgi:hypothetical protein